MILKTAVCKTFTGPLGCLAISTYTLGAMTAAQLFASAREALPNVLTQISGGDFSELLGWLRTNVHSQGKFHNYDDLMTHATVGR